LQKTKKDAAILRVEKTNCKKEHLKMRVTETNRQINYKNFSEYVMGLLKTFERKNCTQISKTMNTSHDSMLRQLDNSSDEELSAKSFAKSVLMDEECILVIDDGRIAKPYAELMEGASLGQDGSSHQVVMGLQMITAMLVGTFCKLPVDVCEYVSKWLAGSNFSTKSEIAKKLTHGLMYTFNISRLIADAHYATYEFISFLHHSGLDYLMKLPCNRKITLLGQTGTIRDLLRLRRNERVRCKKGLYHGMVCFFYVIKHDKDKIVYLISSDYIDPHKVAELYKLRWNIEIFHRTAKQLLGYADCQSRSLTKQLQHCRFVMLAYAIADVFRYQMRLSTTEDAIRALRYSKHPIPNSLESLLDQDFQFYA
jgi:hypothetical protein